MGDRSLINQMKQEAGFHRIESWDEFRKIQVLTIEQLLAGKQPDLPRGRRTFREAQFAREQRNDFTGTVFERRHAAQD